MKKTTKILNIFILMILLATVACASRPSQSESTSKDESLVASREARYQTKRVEHTPYLHPGLLSF